MNKHGFSRYLSKFWYPKFHEDTSSGKCHIQGLTPNFLILLRHLHIVEDKCSRRLWQLPSDPWHSHWHQIPCTQQHQSKPPLCWALYLENTAPGQTPLLKGMRPVSCTALLSEKRTRENDLKKNSLSHKYILSWDY
jgi:hypothetical protein